MHGLFVTFEGIEGSGKTTLLRRVADALRQRGEDPVVTREPGGTDLGLAMRKILLDPQGKELNPVTELMLFAADRAQHVAEIIRPALEEGRIVLCDRFMDATLAYQGYGRGLPLEVVESVDATARGGVRPDLTVLLDLPVGMGLSRVRRRNEQTEDLSESRLDGERSAFHSAVREGYVILAGREPGRFLVLDARREPAELNESVLKRLDERFGDVL